MRKFGLLVWKNWKLQRRHPWQLLYEISIPVSLCLLSVLMMARYNPSHHKECIYTPYPVHNITTLKRYDKIIFSPNTSEVVKIIMSRVIEDFPGITFEGVENAIMLGTDLTTANSDSQIGVVFDDGLKDTLPKNVDIILRFPSELHGETPLDWRTSQHYSRIKVPGPRTFTNNFNARPEYYEEGFLTLQHSVSISVVKYMNDDLDYPSVSMQRYPHPEFDVRGSLALLKNMGVMFILGFIYSVGNITRYVTTEKEQQLKELMKIMGIPNWIHWAAWFTKAMTFLLLVTLIITIINVIDLGRGAVLPETDPLLLFIFVSLYMCSLTTFAFLTSTFFTSADLATSFSMLLFFLTVLPYAVAKSVGLKLLTSLLMNCAVVYGFTTIVNLEITGVGVQWSNLWHNAVEDDVPFGAILIMLVIDSIIYMLLTLYIEAVFPGKYGVPKKWNFIFTQCRFSKTKVGVTDPVETVTHDEETYEPEPTYLTAGIQIVHLKKVYKGPKTAVDDVSLSMFENQITVLLGHNGAGKTTVISMITGVFPPTSGRALVNGYDVETETSKVRSSLSLCPQSNILFEELTVAQHILFFSRLKGVPKSEVNAEIDHYINLLKLEPERDKRSSLLSGGMKRKLQVAVTFCGKSKVVILDEPTSGMDPAARRALWDVVESEKLGRTILLSTHFMDEADIIGDRIAIMARGKLQCYGSSFFLKQKYGSGYLLIIEKTDDCDVDEVTEQLSRHIPDIQLKSNIGSELTYKLKESDRPTFYQMFSDIESNADELGIVSYGVELTTLEDVFLKVGSDTFTESRDNKISIDSEDPRQPYSGKRLIYSQIHAMLLKRYLTTIRRYFLLLIQILLPIVTIVMCMLNSKVTVGIDVLPKLKIDWQAYNSPITILCSEDANNSYYQSAKNILEGKHLSIEDLGSKDVGSYMLNLRKNDPLEAEHYIIGACFNGNEVLGWFSNTPLHSLPLALNFITNSIVKSFDKTREISVYNQPIPFTLKSKVTGYLKDSKKGYEMGINLGFCFVFLAGFYVIFYVKERISKAKHLQMISGVGTLIFWAVSYVWDWMQWILICLLTIIVMVCFQEDSFKTFCDICRVLVILLYTIFALMPMVYLLSFWFNTPSQGYQRMITFLSVGVIIFFFYPVFNTFSFWTYIELFILIHPIYSMALGFELNNQADIRQKYCVNLIEKCEEAMGASQNECKSIICSSFDSCCQESVYYQWEKPGILRNIVISLLTGIILLIFLICKEYKLTKGLFTREGKSGPETEVAKDDSDVEDEKTKIMSMTNDEISQHSLILKNVSKNFPKLRAVDKLYLSVDAQECFGLLGVNGAGKTTTFRMITGDISISEGEIFIKGWNIKKDSKIISTQTGYCPQADGLFDELTIKETVKIFCLIRGYHVEDIPNLSTKLAITFDFVEDVDKKVSQLSGGNQRKLSTAVALIGDPQMIYLDEPTTGMDPVAKRHLWTTLGGLRDSGKCLILTSHSMEECEALCTRLGIMVAGRFKCIGSRQHLKQKFAKGYTLTIKLKTPEDVDYEAPDIEAAIKEFFPDAALKERHHGLIKFYIPGDTVPVSKMFKNLEDAKDSLDIEEYSVSQCGLEEVFLSFTRTED